jgi:ABC-type transporter Mla subunit MlaD
MADVSSVQTKQLGDLTVRLEIERALQQGSLYGSLYLPEANGGRLEVVRAIVSETIQNVLRSGESANQASEKLAAGDDQFKGGHFKQAFRLYSEAYKAAMALPPRPR